MTDDSAERYDKAAAGLALRESTERLRLQLA